MSNLALANFIERGWDQHAEQPAAVAAGLRERVSECGDDAASADAIALAEHVWIAHLGDGPGLRASPTRASRRPTTSSAFCP